MIRAASRQARSIVVLLALIAVAPVVQAGEHCAAMAPIGDALSIVNDQPSVVSDIDHHFRRTVPTRADAFDETALHSAETAIRADPPRRRRGGPADRGADVTAR